MTFKFSVLFAAALASSACAEDEPDLASVDNDLIGGTPTGLRPEVGQIFHSQNTPPGQVAMCTATLIAPRVILTAAHCLEPQPTPVSVPSGAVFVFTDASGAARSVRIDRVHSFSLVDSFVTPIPGDRLTQDVALARLVTAVPPSQATPATIAAQEPVVGATSTWFGFGCTNRLTLAGSGTKRMITFAFGSSTSGCPGDSGGPQVFGGAGGAIWGVATGHDLFGFDIFANVVLYKKQIEDVMHGWLGPDDVGFDRFGFDYAADIATSATACRTLCERDGNCRAFTWRASDNHCWRKSAASEPVPAAGLVSGIPSKLELGIDRMGGDYRAIVAGTAETCAAACGRDRDCQAWTHLGTNCWFKGSVPTASAGTCPGCTSGVARRGLEINVDRPGGDIGPPITGVITAFDCQSRCNKEWRCEAYTHVGSSCFLKNMVPNAVAVSPNLFMTSGVRRGVETESDRPGGDLLFRDTTTLSPTYCQALCAQFDMCVAWTYRPITPAVSRCTLKSTVTARVFSVDTVSGLKGLEMAP
jgi:secreted trypsin-like serine protease